MENDDLNNGEHPPTSTFSVQENYELPHTDRRNDAADSSTCNSRAEPVSFHKPLSSAALPYQPLRHGVPETRGKWMVDLNQIHNWQYPMMYPNSININSNLPCPYRQQLPFPEGDVEGVSYIPGKTRASPTMMNDSSHLSIFQNPEISRNFLPVSGNAGQGYEMTRQGGKADASNFHGPHIDGSFLSLGIGGETDTIYKSDLRTNETISELDRAVSSRINASHVQQGARKFMCPGQNLVGGFSGFPNNQGGFSSLEHNVRGTTPLSSNFGIVHSSNTGAHSRLFNTFQTQADMQHNIPNSINRHQGFVGNRGSGCVHLDPPKGCSVGETTSLGPFQVNSAQLSTSGQAWASGFTLDSVKSTHTTTQPTFNQRNKQFMETASNISSESSVGSSFIGNRGNSIRQGHSGQLFSSKDHVVQIVDPGAQLPKWRHFQPPGQPRMFATDLQGPSFMTGCSQEGQPAQFSKDLLGTTSAMGQAISTTKGFDLPQTPNVSSRPYLKRGAIQPPAAAPQFQRRKLMLKPPVRPTKPSSRRMPVHSSIQYIKRQGSDGFAQPSGHKCMICKRDLAFTPEPEGPVSRQTMLPPVAVLPCGHTFHDLCLLLITPKDQAKNPPCIPCAMGET
ncbi:hypothetical protein NMG60_11004780 [Bertholletia excelsa]